LAGAPPQTPLGELTALPRPPSWILRVLLLREGREGKGEGRVRGKGRARGREGERREGEGKEGGRPQLSCYIPPSWGFLEICLLRA